MKALITQRESKDSHGVLIDVLESTYISFFEELDIELIVISNFHKDISKLLSMKEFDMVILTGGGSINQQFYDKPHTDQLQNNRDIIEYELIDSALRMKKPILAICRGMQYLNGIFAGRVSKLDKMKTPRAIGKDHPVILGHQIVNVNNYHNDGIPIDYLAKEFDVIALDIENHVVEGFYSKDKRILGVQWHPERIFQSKETYEVSRKLIDNFIKGGGILDESYYISCRTRD